MRMPMPSRPIPNRMPNILEGGHMHRLQRTALVLSAGLLIAIPSAVLHADMEPTDCTEYARGEQTGQMYELIGQVEITDEVEVNAVWEFFGFAVSRSVTYNEGTYEGEDGQVITVNCSTGDVTSNK
jgi:hypothetical protein